MNYDRVNDESTILIIDDQPEFAQLLKTKLLEITKSAPCKVSIVPADNIKNYQEYLDSTILTLFLDIEMPVSGFEIAKNITKLNIPLIFISNHDILVFDALLYQPFYFIRKKYLDDDLAKITGWLTHKITNSTYQLTENSTTIAINTNDILYIQSNGNYVEIYTQSHVYTERKTLQNFISDERFKQFLMPARGYLVNYHSIAQVNKDVILINNGVQIFISKKRLKTFYEDYYQLLGGEFNEL